MSTARVKGICVDDSPTKIRHPYPNFNEEKAKEVMLYILKKHPNITEEKLLNMLYFIDFNHYEKHEEHLMGFTYIKI